MLRSKEYLEHFALLVVTEPFVLDAHNHFVFKHGSILLGKQLTGRLPFHLLIPELLVREPGGVGVKNGEAEVRHNSRVFD